MDLTVDEATVLGVELEPPLSSSAEPKNGGGWEEGGGGRGGGGHRFIKMVWMGNRQCMCYRREVSR